MKTIGIAEVAAFAASAAEVALPVAITVDLTANQIGRQRRQPIVADPPPSDIRSLTFWPST